MKCLKQVWIAQWGIFIYLKQRKTLETEDKLPIYTFLYFAIAKLYRDHTIWSTYQYELVTIGSFSYSILKESVQVRKRIKVIRLSDDFQLSAVLVLIRASNLINNLVWITSFRHTRSFLYDLHENLFMIWFFAFLCFFCLFCLFSVFFLKSSDVKPHDVRYHDAHYHDARPHDIKSHESWRSPFSWLHHFWFTIDANFWRLSTRTFQITRTYLVRISFVWMSLSLITFTYFYGCKFNLWL